VEVVCAKKGGQKVRGVKKAKPTKQPGATKSIRADVLPTFASQMSKCLYIWHLPLSELLSAFQHSHNMVVDLGDGHEGCEEKVSVCILAPPAVSGFLPRSPIAEIS
jgi:hypothetical protein